MITIQVRNRPDYDIVEIIIPRDDWMMHDSIKDMGRTFVNFIDEKQLVSQDGLTIVQMADSDNVTMRCIVKHVAEDEMIG